MGLTVFVLMSTIIFAINLIGNVMLLAVNKHNSFPIGNVIGVFLSLGLVVYGIITFINL